MYTNELYKHSNNDFLAFRGTPINFGYYYKKIFVNIYF